MIIPQITSYNSLMTFTSESELIGFIDSLGSVQRDPELRQLLITWYRENPARVWNLPTEDIDRQLLTDSPNAELYDHCIVAIGLGIFKLTGIKDGRVMMVMDEGAQQAIKEADSEGRLGLFTPSDN